MYIDWGSLLEHFWSGLLGHRHQLLLTQWGPIHLPPVSLQAKYFYITPGICPSLSTMKAIVECAGGKVLPRQPSFRKLVEHKHNKVRDGGVGVGSREQGGLTGAKWETVIEHGPLCCRAYPRSSSSPARMTSTCAESTLHEE